MVVTAEDIQTSLYPDWRPPALPDWVRRSGLQKAPRIVHAVCASREKWMQAEADGLSQLAPIIALFNAHPREIKAHVGREHWRRVHHATKRANIDRLVLCKLAGWTFSEAMLFPEKEKRWARSYLHYSKSALLFAIRIKPQSRSLQDVLTFADDFVRMGGVIDLSWGYKRLVREHDAQFLKSMHQRTDPSPWAKPWFFDVDGWSFSLLKSATELALEGHSQRHCVASYASRCRSGDAVVLSIQGPERATCSWGRRYTDLQVKGFANSSVSAACRKAAASARAAYEAHVKDTVRGASK